MQNVKSLLTALLLSVALAGLVGCGTLDPAGPYKGDAVLHASELTTVTAYDVIHTFVTWEYENRAALTKYPEIKKAADIMRRDAKGWLSTANALHDAYVGDPSDANRTALDVCMSVLQAAATEASGYMLMITSKPSTP